MAGQDRKDLPRQPSKPVRCKLYRRDLSPSFPLFSFSGPPCRLQNSVWAILSTQHVLILRIGQLKRERRGLRGTVIGRAAAIGNAFSTACIIIIGCSIVGAINSACHIVLNPDMSACLVAHHLGFYYERTASQYFCRAAGMFHTHSIFARDQNGNIRIASGLVRPGIGDRFRRRFPLYFKLPTILRAGITSMIFGQLSSKNVIPHQQPMIASCFLVFFSASIAAGIRAPIRAPPATKAAPTGPAMPVEPAGNPPDTGAGGTSHCGPTLPVLTNPTITPPPPATRPTRCFDARELGRTDPPPSGTQPTAKNYSTKKAMTPIRKDGLIIHPPSHLHGVLGARNKLLDLLILRLAPPPFRLAGRPRHRKSPGASCSELASSSKVSTAPNRRKARHTASAFSCASSSQMSTSIIARG